MPPPRRTVSTWDLTVIGATGEDNERCVVTENVRDFARLAQTAPHAGIILVSAQRFPRTDAGLAKLGAALDRVLAAKAAPAAGAVIWLTDQASGPDGG